MLKTIKKIDMAMVLFSFMLLIFATVVIAVPEAPSTFTEDSTSTRTPSVAQPTSNALAGNITHLTIVGSTVTQTWQGYVGNVSGTITLDNSKNSTLYDWTLADPEGEVYAATVQSIDWSGVDGFIECWNWTDAKAGDDDSILLAELEGTDTTDVPTTLAPLGLAEDDIDGVNETFSEQGASLHSSFYVGSTYINGSNTGDSVHPPSCPVARLYNASTPSGAGIANETAPFEEVLLYYNGTDEPNDATIIYTAIIKNGDTTQAYNNGTADFEMIVGEDGHDGDTSVTVYYFYVEIE